MTKVYKLKNSIKLLKNQETLKFIFMNKHREVNLKCNEVSEYAVKLLAESMSLSELSLKITKRYPSVSESSIKKFLLALCDIGVVERIEFTKYHNSIIDRQVNLYSDIIKNPIKMQDDLSNQKVLILGLGGAGSNISYFLAQSGIKHFILLDNDRVENTNIGRQALYFEQDIGKYKVDVISKRLKDLNPKIMVKTYKFKITGQQDFNKIMPVPNIIVNCLDEPSTYLTGKWVTDYYLKLNIPMINGIGYRGKIVSLGLTTIPGKTICWNCAYSDYGKEIKGFTPFLKNKHKSEAGVSSPLANFISSIHAQEIINVLSSELKPILTDKYGTIDFFDLSVNWTKIPRKLKKCTLCKNERKDK